ncbi:unnamed protein product [Periconia digitata]|uniref:Uncharacterized protein n=1 Tax=Periconia digitata TaxID=1303443 RepID=A0A9W4XG98_9PLEO|nr:unnamed protein product [Periconia digitata]
MIDPSRQLMAVTATYEDFLYYQAEWTRRNKLSVWMDEHIENFVKLYDKFHVGSRHNVPRVLGPEDIHRYPDDLRKTMPDHMRKVNIDNKFPQAQQTVNYGGAHYTIDQVPEIDDAAMRAKQEQVNRIREAEPDHDIIPTDIYHAATEKTKPFQWNDGNGSARTSRTSFETNKRHQNWGAVIKNGEWAHTDKGTSKRIRYETFIADHTDVGTHVIHKLDKYGLRIRHVYEHQFSFITYDRGEGYIDFRLDEEGNRIDSHQRHINLEARFTTSDERHNWQSLPGRRERAEQDGYIDDFSEEEEDPERYITLDVSDNAGNPGDGGAKSKSRGKSGKRKRGKDDDGNRRGKKGKQDHNDRNSKSKKGKGAKGGKKPTKDDNDDSQHTKRDEGQEDENVETDAQSKKRQREEDDSGAGSKPQKTSKKNDKQNTEDRGDSGTGGETSQSEDANVANPERGGPPPIYINNPRRRMQIFSHSGLAGGLTGGLNGARRKEG